MLGARARLRAQWTWLLSRLTFPQHDQASGAPVAALANVPLPGPAAQRWQLECGGTGPSTETRKAGR
ncbi:nicotinamide riboside kinase 2-like protein [Lates japonicus]|uniref:Nicotinamide riboside kinase 2-like protein n=1 Tax=Lates japonicus TaxID=270547 RepID=A0AAD3NBS2_LATJO|nr:nicotinamide riboside kinase 2-like protein [Lates japonicus]